MDLIPSKIVQERLLKIAEEALGTKNYKIDVRGGTEKGDNYIGVIYRARVSKNCETNGETSNCKQAVKCKDLELIIKVPPENKVRRERFFARPAFLREAQLYDEILPMFMKFQESKGVIPHEGGFHEIAPCFGTITDDMHEAIILKDLTDEGYVMYNRHNYITVDHALLVMRILGKLHAISYAMKDQCPEQMEKYKGMEDLVASRKDDKDMEVYINMITERAIGSLDPEKYQNCIDRLKTMFADESLMNITAELTEGKNAEPYAVISHGDCWNNNILYKYNKNGNLEEARLIDWQISRYSTPVCDLMYFLFLATSREMRAKHYKSFIDTYYQSLSSFVRRLGSDPDKLFPRSALDEQLKKFGKFGLVMGIMLTPILTTYAEDVPDLDAISESLDKKETIENAFSSAKSEGAYKERMTGIILDMFEYGYI